LPTGGARTGDDMNDNTGLFEESDDDILSFEVSDAALERAAASAIPGAALSFPNAPTVSILVVCCSTD
jgi:hypothetical protein